MGHSSAALLWDTLVTHSCGKLLWDTLVGHSCGILLWDTLVGHSCGTLLRDPLLFCLMGHSCRTLLTEILSDSLARDFCGPSLLWKQLLGAGLKTCRFVVQMELRPQNCNSKGNAGCGQITSVISLCHAAVHGLGGKHMCMSPCHWGKENVLV